jgi:hypothetical protein
MAFSFAPLAKHALMPLLLLLPAMGQGAAPDQFTPVTAAPLTSRSQAFLGTDGKYHVDYELVLTNTKPTPATLQKIEVLDAAQPSTVFATYQGDTLSPRLRTLVNTLAKSPEMEFNGTRLFLIDLTFDTPARIPSQLKHRVSVMAAPTPAPVPITPVALSYTVAPIDIDLKVLTIGPPLAGKRWVAINGCCGADGIHRVSGQAVNGGIYFAQRYAIDWMRLDEAGRFVHGDSADVRSYACYDADVLAVADGTVVSVLDNLEDQPPGKLPDVSTITLANVTGNHVILDLGSGMYAFYAHMRKKSVLVQVGQEVKRGQVLGKLGNSGNTSAPHLHFHLMDGLSVLGSNGIPYVIDSMAFAGKIPSDNNETEADDLQKSWSSALFPNATQRHEVFPLDLDIIDFPSAPAGAAH